MTEPNTESAARDFAREQRDAGEPKLVGRYFEWPDSTPPAEQAAELPDGQRAAEVEELPFIPGAPERVDGDGKRDRLTMCGQVAVEALQLDDNSNAPVDVRNAIVSLRQRVSELERQFAAIKSETGVKRNAPTHAFMSALSLIHDLCESALRGAKP